METYVNSEILIFAEGSACHGAELLGPESLSRTSIIMRRPESLVLFEELLRSRSRNFEAFIDTNNIGTIILDGPDGNLVGHLAMAVANWNSLANFLKRAADAELKNGSKEGYISAAREDLRGYIEYHKSNSFVVKESEIVLLESRANAAFEAILLDQEHVNY